MKNDVRYLTQCHNFTGETDHMTGMYTAAGLNNAFDAMKTKFPPETAFPAVFLRVCQDREEEFSKDYIRERIAALIAAAESVRSFAEKRGLYGRVSENSFIVICGADADTIADALRCAVLSNPRYREQFGTDSLFCAGETLHANQCFSDIRQSFTQQIEAMRKEASLRRLLPQYDELIGIRDRIYREPVEEYRIEPFAKQCMVSVNYFNARYKACFGVSFHQDCISSRITLAKHLLSTTGMRIVQVAEACGYADSKYFSRQFSAAAGLNPKQYRELFRS